MAETQTALRQYEYGGNGLFGFFMPERREILSPEQRLDMGYTSTRRGPGIKQISIPAKLGEPEVGFEYMPAYRAGKSALNAVINLFTDPPSLDEAKEAGINILQGIDQSIKDQYTAGALGGRAYNPETGQVTEFDPVTPATMLAPTGFLSSAARTPGSTTLFSWGGPMSRKADQEKLFQANRMEDAGSTAEEIKNATGWQRNLDGEWMYWIPDNKSQIQSTKMRSDMLGLEASDKELALQDEMFQGIHSYFQRPLGEILKHEELYEAYPELAKYPVSYRFDNSSTRGSFSPYNQDITLNVRDKDKSRTGVVESKSTLMHEISHAISDIEGRTGGGSVAAAPQIVETAERLAKAPYEDAYIRYNIADNEMGALFKVSEYQDLEKFAQSDDLEGFLRHPLFNKYSGAILSRMSTPSGPAENEGFFDEVLRKIRMYEVANMDSEKSHFYNKGVSSSPERTKRRIKDLSKRKEENKESHDKWDQLNRKYSDLRMMGGHGQYSLINDEYLARTVQKLMDDKRSTYDIPLYRQVEDMDTDRFVQAVDYEKALFENPYTKDNTIRPPYRGRR